MVSFTRYLPSLEDVYNHLCVQYATTLSKQDCITFFKCLPYGKRVTEYQILCALYHSPKVPESLYKRIEQIAHTIWLISTGLKSPDKFAPNEETSHPDVGGTASHEIDTSSKVTSSSLTHSYPQSDEAISTVFTAQSSEFSK